MIEFKLKLKDDFLRDRQQDSRTEESCDLDEIWKSFLFFFLLWFVDVDKSYTSF